MDADTTRVVPTRNPAPTCTPPAPGPASPPGPPPPHVPFVQLKWQHPHSGSGADEGLPCAHRAEVGLWLSACTQQRPRSRLGLCCMKPAHSHLAPLSGMGFGREAPGSPGTDRCPSWSKRESRCVRPSVLTHESSPRASLGWGPPPGNRS